MHCHFDMQARIFSAATQPYDMHTAMQQMQHRFDVSWHRCMASTRKAGSMTSPPLNYMSPQTTRQYTRRWPWRTLSVVATLSLLLIASLAVTVRQIEGWIDPVTGSMMGKTVWLFGITTGPHVNVSALELRLKSSGIRWTPSWRFLHNTHLNIFGGATCHECGSAPPIYQVRPVLEEFAAASTDAELREFVRVMQSGTDAEQKAAVDAAGEKGLGALSRPARADSQTTRE
jgi:hypothetical protein